MKGKLKLVQAPMCCVVALGLGSSFSLAAAPENSADSAPAKTSVPWSQIGAKAGADYPGDGLAVIPNADGAQLRCVFRRLEGEVTREGLWLTSTGEGNQSGRLRVMAKAVGRAPNVAQPSRLRVNGASSPPSASGDETSPQLAGQDACATAAVAIPRTGTVEVADKLVRFVRPGLTEEYTVSMDGVRQDFIIEQRPVDAGPLRVELDVTGAKVEPLADGARLVLEESGRKIAYSRLRVTDATGKELTARMEVIQEGARNSFRFDSATTEGSESRLQPADLSNLLRSPPSRAKPAKAGTPNVALAVLVNDAEAVYPVRIDSTFSDANWISMGGIPGANDDVYAAVVDGSGDLYIGGRFTAVGDVFANYIGKWNGSSWAALGSGLNGGVSALAVSGSDVYAGGTFTTAGGSAANYVAKWNGSSWWALGSGLGGVDFTPVRALAVSGSDVYAGGYFRTAGGSAANYIAKWDGNGWTALGSGVGGPSGPAGTAPAVFALAASGSDLYAGGYFYVAGGKVSGHIARAYLLTLPALSVLRSGTDVMVSWPSVDTAGFALEQAGALATPASWVTNTTRVTDNGTNKLVTIPATNSPQFFRLRRP